jgi:F0F1-type ATP synthase assembly protein I
MPAPDDPSPARARASGIAPSSPDATPAPAPAPDEPRVPPKRARWFLYTDASSLGIEIAVAVTVGAVGGYYIERYLTHWSPWTMLLGFAFGIVVATKAVLRTARTYQASLRRDAAEQAAAAASEAQPQGSEAHAEPPLSSPSDAPRRRHARHPSDEHEQRP